ncbi:MAG TPA: FAD-dependent oxidoreductase, partial [Gemmatimonadota bacterium]|nr:FAD-dependent oxidoreductase [Gemmatimonadota bacterium]
MPDERVDVLVVGAGLSGLVLLRELEARGVDALALEASGRPGGVAWTFEAEGRLLEYGPQRIRPSGPVGDLVRTLGLEDRLLVSPGELPLFVYRGGSLGRIPLSVGELLGTRLLSPAAKLRLLAEPLTGPARPGETVAGFLTRKLGREAYLHLAGPLYGGLYGSDPSEMLVEESLGHILRRFGVGRSLGIAAVRMMGRRGQAPPPATFFGGMAELPRALEREHAGRIRFRTRVVDLRRDGDGWRAVVARGGGETAEEGRAEGADGPVRAEGAGAPVGAGAGVVEIAADRVALTVPAPEAAPLLRGQAPEAAERVGRLR